MMMTLSAHTEVYNLLELTHLTAAHALALRQQVGAMDTIQVAPTGCKAIMLAALQVAEIDILTTFPHVAVDGYDAHQVCGMWTLHDLTGHLADWDHAAGVRRTLALALPEGLLHFHGPYTD
jgi:putative heme iron utilization protein